MGYFGLALSIRKAVAQRKGLPVHGICDKSKKRVCIC